MKIDALPMWTSHCLTIQICSSVTVGILLFGLHAVIESSHLGTVVQ